MPITIKHPTSGTAGKLNKLPKKFIAWGRKDANQVPVGLLYSAKSDGTPDGKRMIGGVPLPKAKLGEDKWALCFRVPRAKPNDRYTLIVLDGKDLPSSITATGVPKADYLGFKRHERVSFSGRLRGGEGKKPEQADLLDKLAELLEKAAVQPEVVEYPEPQNQTPVPYDEFVAYGTLPSGDYGIDEGETKVINRANSAETGPDWSWTDGTGFWAAFWPPLTQGAVVDLHVVYAPSSSDEVIQEIQLT